MLQRGNRLLSAASVLLLVIAALHTLGIVFPGGGEGELAKLVGDMKSHTVDMGFGMRPSVWSMTRNPSLSMAVLLVFVGLQSLIAVSLRPDDERLIHLLKVSGTGFCWILAALAAAYRLPPALLTFTVAALLFSASHFERPTQGTDS